MNEKIYYANCPDCQLMAGACDDSHIRVIRSPIPALLVRSAYGGDGVCSDCEAIRREQVGAQP